MGLPLDRGIEPDPQPGLSWSGPLAGPLRRGAGPGKLKKDGPAMLVQSEYLRRGRVLGQEQVIHPRHTD